MILFFKTVINIQKAFSSNNFYSTLSFLYILLISVRDMLTLYLFLLCVSVSERERVEREERERERESEGVGGLLLLCSSFSSQANT